MLIVIPEESKLSLPPPEHIQAYRQEIEARILRAELLGDCSEETVREIVQVNYPEAKDLGA